MNARTLALMSALALALPVAANAQRPGVERAVPRGGNQTENSPAFRNGLERGTRIGEEDGRANRQFDFERNSEYRSGDRGWNRNYGDRESWRFNFRLGFERGYREGYGRYRPGYGGYGNSGGYGGYGRDDGWRPGAGGPPPWANGRGRGRGGYQQTDLAFRNGFTDGYDEGLKDAQRRDRFDPTDEGRYRSGDHGYNNRYGYSRDAYRLRYREGFREGYEYGFEEARRYGYRNNSGRPSWWPW